MSLVKKIVQASWHRNGVGGVGFYAILFESEYGLMVASLFDEPGYCAVYLVERLSNPEIGVRFGENDNSWRGDRYEAVLRPMLQDYLETSGSDGSIRVGPFGIPTERS